VEARLGTLASGCHGCARLAGWVGRLPISSFYRIDPCRTIAADSARDFLQEHRLKLRMYHIGCCCDAGVSRARPYGGDTRNRFLPRHCRRSLRVVKLANLMNLPFYKGKSTTSWQLSKEGLCETCARVRKAKLLIKREKQKSTCHYASGLIGRRALKAGAGLKLAQTVRTLEIWLGRHTNEVLAFVNAHAVTFRMI
jgi:hypothetical protein